MHSISKPYERCEQLTTLAALKAKKTRNMTRKDVEFEQALDDDLFAPLSKLIPKAQSTSHTNVVKLQDADRIPGSDCRKSTRAADRSAELQHNKHSDANLLERVVRIVAPHGQQIST